jgi:hypothetical protein
MKVSEFDNSYVLLTDSQDVDAVLQSIGSDSTWLDYGFLLVKEEGGDYKEVWESWYSIPLPHRPLERLYPKEKKDD